MSEQKEYIEKEAAIAAANILNIYRAITPEDAVTIVVRRINNTPPAEVKPVVRGAWVKVDDDLYRCSHCHSEIEMRDIYITECRYCPICGAEMRRGK